MSHLIAVAYADLRSAENARREIARLTVERVLEIEDAVIVARDPRAGVRVHQGRPVRTRGAAIGAIWGGLIGMLLLGPLLGEESGGVDPRFIRRLRLALGRDGAALLVLVRRCTPEVLLPQIAEYGGSAFQTPLGADAEGRLAAAIGA